MIASIRTALMFAAFAAGAASAVQAQSGPSALAQGTDPAPAPGADTPAVKPASGNDSQLARQLELLKARIEQLETEVKEQKARALADSSDTAALKAAEKALVGVNGSAVAAVTPAAAPVQPGPAAAIIQNAATTPPPADPHAPAFSDWDWTWLNGNPRNKDVAFDSKFFTPEIRADITYTYDFNKPTDDTMSGSSELFRTNEIQVEQLGLGGDFHLDHAHARFMTQFGMYSTATVRNDPSYSKGQWDIADADRYLSEAYGGYQITGWKHGINVDAGIFMSYVGLFSYYNFDNWAYQPSYVSSNTPWFFEGIRIQMFPTEHLKIEPWIINGWQSYGSSNSRKGLGGQIKWTPYPWMNIISNNYGLGHDDLYVTNRGRLHTDNSIEIKYYDKPSNGLDKMAFSFTADAGCEFGPTIAPSSTNAYGQAGVACHGTGHQPGGIVNPKQSFVGYMVYNRFWTHHDLNGFTIGGGQINNPGRYLVLLPPINGETASSAALNAPYFTGNPGDQFKAWDGTLTYDYMPKQWFTWRWEYGYRHASVPYWSGHGGMTPPPYLGAAYGSNNGSPTNFVCMDGSSVPGGGQVTVSGLTQTAPAFVGAYCGAPQGTAGFNGHGGVWFPDLRRDEQYVDIDLLVKF